MMSSSGSHHVEYCKSNNIGDDDDDDDGEGDDDKDDSDQDDNVTSSSSGSRHVECTVSKAK